VSALAELARRVAAGETCALATVVGTEGSSPAEPAMKMVVGASGRLAGTIGGGHVEAAVETKAREVLAGGVPEILSFTLDDDLADDAGMICGGTMRVLVERVAPPAPWAAAALELLGSGRRGAILARIGEEVTRETVRGRAADPYLDSEEPRLAEGLFVEPLITPRCLILGAGHVGRAVARVARVAGLYVAVVEDRQDQAEKARGLCDEVVCADLVDGFGELEPGPDDYVVVMTRGHGLDLKCVRAALLSPARYVGMLASRRKARTIREALAKERVEADERLHAPIGLDLGASSAGEIAVSVVAQLVKVRRLGRGDR
jgi:xanthine dehydrogenase accessory factor